MHLLKLIQKVFGHPRNQLQPPPPPLHPGQAPSSGPMGMLTLMKAAQSRLQPPRQPCRLVPAAVELPLPLVRLDLPIGSSRTGFSRSNPQVQRPMLLGLMLR